MKKNIDKAIENLNGRFCSIKHTAKGKTSLVCAKILKSSKEYITITDVNKRAVRKMKKTGISRISSGKIFFKV